MQMRLRTLAVAAAVALGVWTPPSVGAAETAVTMGGISVSFRAFCDAGVAVFEITNTGPKWEKPGTFKVYRTQDQRVVSQRRMRLAEGQRAKFKVRKADKTGEVGLFIDPAWMQREFDYDVLITCR